MATATRPPISATVEPSGVPPPSGDTLATGVDPEPGPTVGNSPAALPPGLAVVVGAATPIGAVAGVKLAPTGLDGARTATEALAAGASVRLAAVPVTVRLSAVMVVAVAGTVTSACSCRWAELASTAPRSHTDVPLPVPQPKVKAGPPAPAVAASWILASGTLPPTVQAPTAHWDACPRWMLCCRGATPTHKLTPEVVAAAGTW